MSDYEVGYGKTPRHSRFKAGGSGNPKGRPKRTRLEVREIVKEVLNARVEYREGGRPRKASRRELSIRRHLKRAVKGDVASAKALLQLRSHALRRGDTSILKVQVCDLLPDDPGQTGQQTARRSSR